MKHIVATLAAATFLALPSTAIAQQIVGPTSATVNSGGSYETSINDTFNQNGLATPYVSGSTDFTTYIATDPQHTFLFANSEWFSSSGAATVTYDLGSILGIDALALWNEDARGIPTLNLLGSTDDAAYFALGLFNPADNPAGEYGPEVFSFSAVDLRYVRFEMSGCSVSCAIGEVAFRTASTGAVPEPGTWAMMLLGFGAVGVALRRRKQPELSFRRA